MKRIVKKKMMIAMVMAVVVMAWSAIIINGGVVQGIFDGSGGPDVNISGDKWNPPEIRPPKILQD